VPLEMENDEIDYLRDDPGRNLRGGRRRDGKVVDVQHKLRHWPIPISNDDDVNEQESELCGSQPRPSSDATRRDK
jgi:hypothetical protein